MEEVNMGHAECWMFNSVVYLKGVLIYARYINDLKGTWDKGVLDVEIEKLVSRIEDAVTYTEDKSKIISEAYNRSMR